MPPRLRWCPSTLATFRQRRSATVQWCLVHQRRKDESQSCIPVAFMQRRQWPSTGRIGGAPDCSARGQLARSCREGTLPSQAFCLFPLCARSPQTKTHCRRAQRLRAARAEVGTDVRSSQHGCEIALEAHIDLRFVIAFRGRHSDRRRTCGLELASAIAMRISVLDEARCLSDFASRNQCR
jgi:hypothetical protein